MQNKHVYFACFSLLFLSYADSTNNDLINHHGNIALEIAEEGCGVDARAGKRRLNQFLRSSKAPISIYISNPLAYHKILQPFLSVCFFYC